MARSGRGSYVCPFDADVASGDRWKLRAMQFPYAWPDLALVKQWVEKDDTPTYLQLEIRGEIKQNHILAALNLLSTLQPHTLRIVLTEGGKRFLSHLRPIHVRQKLWITIGGNFYGIDEILEQLKRIPNLYVGVQVDLKDCQQVIRRAYIHPPMGENEPTVSLFVGWEDGDDPIDLLDQIEAVQTHYSMLEVTYDGTKDDGQLKRDLTWIHRRSERGWMREHQVQEETT